MAGPETVMHEIDNVWYETPERVEKLWKGLVYSDKGRMLLTDAELIFEGNKFQLRISDIKNVQRKRIKGKLLAGKGYIEVDYNENGLAKKAFFLSGAVAVWTMAKETDHLYETVVNWWKKDKLEATAAKEFCRGCGQHMTLVPKYQKWYCYNCKRYG
jgi:hypothetical protein